MPDPTPEERANDALEEVRTYLSWVPPDHAKAAHDALLAAEAKCARLAREVEELRGALRRISERMPPGTINETCGSIARAALSEPTEREETARD